MAVRVLLLEDDAALAMGIVYSLKSEGYEVVHIPTFIEAKKYLEKCVADASIDDGSYETVGIFDVMLPDGNGFELLKLIREAGITFPVVFLTAVSDENNIVQGLDIGADDYITKPFHVKELMSRLKAVIRRYRIGESIADRTSGGSKSANSNLKSDINSNTNNDTNSLLYHKDIIIDTLKASVYKQDTDAGRIRLELTQSEYKLLLLFINNKNVVLERNAILSKIFDSNGAFVDDNTLSVYIRRLRSKLGEEYEGVPYIKTVRGIGYMMEE